jgi:hypothetical protein
VVGYPDGRPCAESNRARKGGKKRNAFSVFNVTELGAKGVSEDGIASVVTAAMVIILPKGRLIEIIVGKLLFDSGVVILMTIYVIVDIKGLRRRTCASVIHSLVVGDIGDDAVLGRGYGAMGRLLQ